MLLNRHFSQFRNARVELMSKLLCLIYVLNVICHVCLEEKTNPFDNCSYIPFVSLYENYHLTFFYSFFKFFRLYFLEAKDFSCPENTF